MGIIRSTDKSMTNIQYKVDDMTGAPMDVKQWVDTEVSEDVLHLYIKERNTLQLNAKTHSSTNLQCKTRTDIM